MKTSLELFESCLHGPWITSGNDVQYKFELVDTTLYIYFQCTNSSLDWKQNIKFWLNKYKMYDRTYYGHAGYVENWESIKHQLIDYIKIKLNWNMNIDSIVLVGYSHGGAIATLAHQYLIEFNMVANTFIFGSPNVVWAPFNKNYNRDFKMLNNYKIKGDLFSMLPFTWLGFKEIGNVIKLGNKKVRPSVIYHFADEYRTELKKLQEK